MNQSLEQSLNTKAAVIISVTEYSHKGQIRNMIKARKANGNKVFSVVQYESGLYSSAV